MPARLSADDIHAAATRLRGHVLDTPCLPSRTLGELAGCEVFLKFENHQFTASFKERGALNRIALLTAQERAHGVLAVSAGNHAQGVAYHAQRLGIPATIVMPRFAPAVKVERTRGFGADGGARGRQLRRRARARPATGSAARPDAGASLRRRGGDGRPGHDRARDAGAAACARRDRRRRRRRRADQRRGHRGARDQAGHRDRRRADRALPRRLECVSRRAAAVRPGDDRRRHRRQVARRADAAADPRARRRHAAGLGRRHRAGDPAAARDREDGGRGCRRGRPGGAHEALARASPGARSG